MEVQEVRFDILNSKNRKTCRRSEQNRTGYIKDRKLAQKPNYLGEVGQGDIHGISFLKGDKRSRTSSLVNKVS